MVDNRVWGGLCTVLASVLSNFGINTQKQSLRAHPGPRYWARRRWWAGMLCVILGALGDFAALGLASAALVTALGGTAAMASNVVLAKRMNDERVSRWDAAGLILACAGALLVSALSPPLFATLEALERHLREPALAACMGTQALGVAVALRPRGRRGAGAAGAGAHTLAACSGVVGSFSVMAGSVVSLALAKLLSPGYTGQVPAVYLWLPLPLMLLCVIGQIHLLSRALQLSEVVVIYPVFQTVWSGCTAVSCVALYGSSPGMLLGLGCMAGGVWCLRKHTGPSSAGSRSSGRHYSVCEQPKPPAPACGETRM